MTVRYAHTNIVAEDWRKLAAFYQTVFACTPVPPERNQSGEVLARATGVPGAALQGGGYGAGCTGEDALAPLQPLGLPGSR